MNENFSNIVKQNLIDDIKLITRSKPTLYDRWYDDFGGCIDMAKQLLNSLSNSYPNLKLQVGAGHISITDSLSSNKEKLIIDPSYLQFFRDGVANGMGSIFIGTLDDAIKLFTDNSMLGTHELQKSPEEFVMSLYERTSEYIN